MRYRVLIFFLFGSLLVRAQQPSAADRDTLTAARERMSVLIETVYTDSSAERRFQACRDLIRELVTALDRPHSFAYDFGQLPGLSIQYAPDSSLRTFSWELAVDRDTYRHYGALQRNTEDLQLTPLLDRGDTWLENPENAIVKAENWLGYVVYRIAEGGEYRGQPYYFVLGYDTYEAFRRRKIIDVLHFDANGEPVFGLPIFTTYTESGLLLEDRARMIFQYGAEASMALRFDPDLGGVVYENLLLVPGNYGEGPVYMPDGSYRILQLNEAGMWEEEEQVFTHKYEEAPREAAKPSEGRDLLGRERKPGGGGG